MLLYFSLAVFLSTADAVCYKPTGAAQVSDFVPCNSFNVENSFCCGAGRAEGLDDDVCMSNGLCSQFTVNETNIDTMKYWREGCSNRDWPEEVCLRNVCPDPSQNDSNGNARITPCDGTPTSRTWCCGETKDCCGKGGPDEIILQATLGAPVPTSSRISSATGGSSQITTSTTSSDSSVPTSRPLYTATSAGTYTSPSVSQTPASSTRESVESTTIAAAPSQTASSGGLSTGAVAGIGAASGAIGVALIGAIVLLCMRRSRKNRLHGQPFKCDSVSPSESASQHPLGPTSGVGYPSQPVSQVGMPHSGPAGYPPPPSLFSPTETVGPHYAHYPPPMQMTTVYPKHEVESPTAELDVDRPIRELPADSAVGYFKKS